MPLNSAPKLLLVELNEITWRLLDPLVEQGELPAFAELIQRGARATSMAPEVPPDLDPWISWMTVYTGRPSSEHGVKFLEQPPETVNGPRLWDIAADAGRSVGIFGSIMSWPPRTDIRGFWVPGTFSPSQETFPVSLEPIQALNLTYTRAHKPLAEKKRRLSKLGLIWKLRGLGLRSSTLAEIASFYARRTCGLGREWEKVSLQPLVNLDFFAALWAKHQPDFATFHSNHVAHYQHRYWRAHDPTPFLEQPSAEEKRKYREAVRFGYRSADRLLARMLRLVGPDTIIVIASGLGQQPYVNEEFRDGRSVVRLRDIHQVLELIGVGKDCEPYSVMAPQWNLRMKSPAGLARAERALKGAYYGTPDRPLFSYLVAGDTICVNVYQKLPRPINGDTDCVFPESDRRVKMRDLCAEKDPTPKQGNHDQAGVLILAGPGIRPGVDLGKCSTLDVAPTLLSIMQLAVPEYMQGHVLEEAFSRRVQHRQSPSVDESPSGEVVASPAR
jgi:hypothetical protein